VDAPLLAGRMTAFVAARYAALLNSWDGAPDPQFERKLRLLRGLNQDLALMQRTLQRANLQENAYQQHIEDAHEKNTEKARQLALTPLHAALERESLKKLFALYVGGKEAGKLADLVIEVKYNLSSLKRAAPSRRSSQTRSNPVKPKPPVASSLRLEPNPHVASALRADDRAGGSTLQSQDAPSAPRAEPNPHVASALRADDRAGGSTLQSQTESNPVKPEPPIISGFSGSAVVSTASAGVPPAESSDKDRLTISDA